MITATDCMPMFAPLGGPGASIKRTDFPAGWSAPVESQEEAMLAERHRIRALLVAVVLTACTSLGVAQERDNQASGAELDRLLVPLSRFLEVLPSLEVEENATATQSLHGIALRTVRTTTRLQFHRSRNVSGGIYSEHFKRSKGGEYVPFSVAAALPLSLTGEFDQLPRMVISPAFRSCLVGDIVEQHTTTHLRYRLRAPEGYGGECNVFGKGFTADVFLDSKSGSVLRLARRMQEIGTAESKAAVFFDVTYAAVPIAGEILRLPQRIYAEDERGDVFVGTYSDWHRYHVTAKILPPQE